MHSIVLLPISTVSNQFDRVELTINIIIIINNYQNNNNNNNNNYQGNNNNSNSNSNMIDTFSPASILISFLSILAITYCLNKSYSSLPTVPFVKPSPQKNCSDTRLLMPSAGEFLSMMMMKMMMMMKIKRMMMMKRILRMIIVMWMMMMIVTWRG